MSEAKAGPDADGADAREDAEASEADPEGSPHGSKGAGRRKAKKERVLHTRIPAVLEQELKAAADGLRIPVSNLVRTILEDAVSIADRASEQVEDRLSRAARSVHEERERIRERVRRPASLDDVLAYQPVVIAATARCARCDASLRAGDEAALAVGEGPGPKRFVCIDCIPRPEERDRD